MDSRPIIALKLSKQIKETLLGCGYETAQDILATPADSLARDLGVSPAEVEDIIQTVKKNKVLDAGVHLTRTAAAVINSTRKFSTRWPSLDTLLHGGLTRGNILEISGPPGSAKEKIAIDITASFLEAGESVIFIDCQNMTPLSRLCGRLSTLEVSAANLHYTTILSAAEVVIFLHSIPTILESMPKASLLVLNTLSFPFSCLPNPRTKSSILEQIRPILTKASFTRNLTVVITSQMATKVLKEDGTSGSFDEGGRGFMMSQLGSSYLPPGRSHRVILSLESPTSGSMYLLPSSSSSELKHIQQETYSIQ